MFADSAKIFQIIRLKDDYSALQKDLHTWSVNWQLKFNILKCHLGPHHHIFTLDPIITFSPWTPSSHFHLRPHHHHIFLNGIEIDKTTLHKDLGILFDDNLKFITTRLQLLAKIIVCWGLLVNLLNFLSQ